MLHLPRLMFQFLLPYRPARSSTVDDFFHKFPHIELRLVEIGNFGRVEAVERLLEGKDRAECIALVELGLEYRNAGADQAVLDMRLCRASEWTGSCA